ncbi:hypothetical protein [Noviherbaspirillum suwonense]|uniref:Outer membrane protein beta-barrel domain-containing protein n=1 Tax=Noviherbaspirillum suwonense TaxID=1224511 RepID=A0ABY1PW24_9BURK|nr:hypothetical protein [Noviherbaspirillum suwonense]SMP45763.1 hypothetical protein SAMN06295970_101562 [Noviherbaspirillum suwonense]
MQSEKITLAVFAFAGAAAALPAHAQFDASMAPAVRYTSISEHDRAGSRIVHESGWLPGIAGRLAHRSGPLELFGEAAVFQADIDYDGQLQNGRPYRSETGTRMAEAQLGLRYRILDATDIVAALGVDSWRRHIGGSGQAIGLQEHARSGRLLIGIEQAWRFAGTGTGIGPGTLTAGASFVHATPERLRIGFSGLLDDVSIRTRSANGVALALRYRPEAQSRLVFAAQFDYLRVPRSAAYPVTRDGRAAGEVTQPEHVRQNLTLSVRYSF